jgi:very-short-patch-repair endonuclease
MQVLFQIEEQEIAVERIGQEEERRLLFWEAAEGGNGIWTRIMEEPTALGNVAEEALRICHFDPETGEDVAEKDTCSRACYRCLLSYSNQTDHPRLDRLLIRDYLIALKQSITTKVAQGRDYEEQYQWLQEKRDPNSSLESKFLSVLYASRRRLPDRAQFRPEKGIYCEADFYYERDGLNGVAVFIDGPSHDDPIQQQKDSEQRTKLEDLGYRVVVIRYDKGLEEQIISCPDIFGPGI